MSAHDECLAYANGRPWVPAYIGRRLHWKSLFDWEGKGHMQTRMFRLFFLLLSVANRHAFPDLRFQTVQ